MFLPNLNTVPRVSEGQVVIQGAFSPKVSPVGSVVTGEDTRNEQQKMRHGTIHCKLRKSTC